MPYAQGVQHVLASLLLPLNFQVSRSSSMCLLASLCALWSTLLRANRNGRTASNDEPVSNDQATANEVCDYLPTSVLSHVWDRAMRHGTMPLDTGHSHWRAIGHGTRPQDRGRPGQHMWDISHRPSVRCPMALSYVPWPYHMPLGPMSYGLVLCPAALSYM